MYIFTEFRIYDQCALWFINYDVSDVCLPLKVLCTLSLHPIDGFMRRTQACIQRERYSEGLTYISYRPYRKRRLIHIHERTHTHAQAEFLLFPVLNLGHYQVFFLIRIVTFKFVTFVLVFPTCNANLRLTDVP